MVLKKADQKHVKFSPPPPDPFAATYLSVLVKYISKQSVGIWESLGPCALPHAYHPVLFRVKHTTLQNMNKH